MPNFHGWVGKRHFSAKTKKSKRTKRLCNCCTRPVRRSGKTGILWPDCYVCRHLKATYGPSIKVTYHPKHEDD